MTDKWRYREDVPIWQVASGDGTRDYVEFFRRHGIVALGWGQLGEWRPDEPHPQREIRAFGGSMVTGDVVVLRRGRSELVDVGIVGDYAFVPGLRTGSDWQMWHVRSVTWLDVGEHRFAGRPFAIGAFRGCHHAGVRQWIATRLAHVTGVLPPVVDPSALPKESGSLADERIPEDLRPLCRHAAAWKDDTWGGAHGSRRPTEQDGLVWRTIPLLQEYGIKPEHMAIGWNFVDLAVFDDVERSPTSCRLLVESKRLGTGLVPAADQARRYVTTLGLPQDVPVLLTDGVMYRLYPQGAVGPSATCDDEAIAVDLSRPTEDLLAFHEQLQRIAARLRAT